jgi:hypothetical protein
MVCCGDEYGQHRAGGGGKVCAGISIWHREYVDSIQMFLSAEESVHTCTQRKRELRRSDYFGGQLHVCIPLSLAEVFEFSRG